MSHPVLGSGCPACWLPESGVLHLWKASKAGVEKNHGEEAGRYRRHYRLLWTSSSVFTLLFIVLVILSECSSLLFTGPKRWLQLKEGIQKAAGMRLLVRSQAWTLSVSVGTEPMSLGSPTSPKPTSGAQFLPGFLLGDLPAPASPQPRSFSLSSPISESKSAHRGEQEDASAAASVTTPQSCVLFVLAGGSGGVGSAMQPVVPTPKDKSGAPPVRSIHDDLVTVGTPLSAHRQVSML